MPRIIDRVVLFLPALATVLHTLVRIIRRFHKFPIPEFAANVIDNPLRRRMQPPDEMATKHGIEPGMSVLEIGSGNGTYTVATARKLRETGRTVAVDIEPKMIERVRRRIRAECIQNVDVRLADVHDLPYKSHSFDADYKIAVIGEIPEPERAIKEIRRVLGPAGTLAFSELILDPDYPRASTLTRWATAGGFRLVRKVGHSIHYTLVLAKPSNSLPPGRVAMSRPQRASGIYEADCR